MTIGSFICKFICKNSKLKLTDVKVDKDVLEKELENEAKMHTLQSHINPHFLYNTLDSIRSQALINGQDEIGDMIETLGTFFRYNISQKGSNVTVREEVKSVENYFKIQKFRFGDKINLEIAWDAEKSTLIECQMPKLTMQPLVENAIYHGLEPKRGVGHIKIRIDRTEKKLLIIISDDGVGMDTDSLISIKKRIHEDQFIASFDETKSLALRNVNQRIRLKYGVLYGMQIKSIQGYGTEIFISLPIIKSGD